MTAPAAGTENLAEPFLDGAMAESLLIRISDWGPTTTIILHGGCVFEFKGDFPKGQSGQGFYNLDSSGKGFEGHLNLQKIHRITFQTRPHRGRESCALVFRGHNDDIVFKVFVGRDNRGELIESQRKEFNGLLRQAKGGAFS